MPTPTRRLPRHPNLHQLRKQAKDLLQQYRAGQSDAVAEVHRYELRPDAATFALSDAQRVLARAYGYESWPKLKAFVDGANIQRLVEAAKAGDLAAARSLLTARPELAHMDLGGEDEHRALHFAVMAHHPEMVRLLMQAGADARKGIFPHRDATSALALARDREYRDIVAIIEEEEQQRRQTMSCPNSTVSALQEQINDAIRAGDGVRARGLIEQDLTVVNACDREGATPLHLAAEAGDRELAAWLLSRGASPRRADSQGFTPLDRAALAAPPQFPEIGRLLLDSGAPLTIRGAVALKDQSRLREMIGADPGLLRRAIDWRRGWLLTLAVRHGHLDMVRLLLDLGADVDERTRLHEFEDAPESAGHPLWLAAQLRRHDIAELLLQRGADPNANPYASGWAIDHAYRQQDEPMKQLLLRHGARPQPWTVTLAHDLEAARAMLAADPGEELAVDLSWSAACNGCPEILELALPRIGWAADDALWERILVQPPRRAGENGLEEPYFRCMELLLQRADSNVSRRFGQTALHFTAARGTLSESARVRFAEMLVDRGARLDVRDTILRSTPLGWACRWGRTELAEFLIARGAPVKEADADEWAQPLAWANKMGHTGLAAILRQHTA